MTNIIKPINFAEYVDINELKKFENFLHKVNEKWELQYGLRTNYDFGDDLALAPDVEFFGSFITQDDRMRYIIENIVAIPDTKLSQANKIGNTIISHFYGARGIHQIMSGINDPMIAHVDFERLNKDKDYLEHIKENANIAKQSGKKFYGTTELHTSLQTAGRNFCRVKYDEPSRKSSNVDILEWIASWTTNGMIDKILEAKTLAEMFKVLTSNHGIGEYYGYHCATSNSVNTALPFHHDETFCAPGPGAKASLDNMFGPLKTSGKVKKMPYGDLVIWIRENQDNIFEVPVRSHPFFHNYEIDGQKVFKHDQDDLKIYTTEVSLCQFGIYCYLSQNPHLINKRKVARLEDTTKQDTLTNNLLEW
jgi:hypothetical protein